MKPRTCSITGQLVSTLAEGNARPGRYVTTWTGTDDRGRRLPAGVYFIALAADNQRLNRKVVLTGAR